MSKYGLKEIARDMFSGQLKFSVEELATERMKICKSCPNFKPVSKQCSKCGCFMDLKTKLLDASCPIELW